MKRLQRAAIILSLIEAMREKDSWCGETNIQKTSYFLQELTEVPLELEFVLYKYGPYSFQLTDELTAMRADSILKLHVRDPKYGPSYLPGDLKDLVLKSFPKTVKLYKDKIFFVAERLGDKGITDLERFATALHVYKEKISNKIDDQARRIHDIKPHITLKSAKEAIADIKEMYKELAK
jgi:hypothetical protein